MVAVVDNVLFSDSLYVSQMASELQNIRQLKKLLKHCQVRILFACLLDRNFQPFGLVCNLFSGLPGRFRVYMMKH